MQVSEYRKEVEAVYFDGITDVQEIAQWCGGMVVQLVGPDGRLRNDLYIIDVPMPGGNFSSAGQDSIIFKENGMFLAMARVEFESMFTPIDD